MIERYPNGNPNLWARRSRWLVCKNRYAMGWWWVLSLDPGRFSVQQLLPDFASAIAYADRMERQERP